MTPIDKASTPPPASLGDMQLTGLERWLLAQLAVPAQPEPPEGSPGSIQIFRAGKNYYIWSVLAWCAKSLVAVGGLAAMTLAIVTGLRASSDLVRGVIFTVLGLIWLVVIVTLTTTFLARRLTYLLRWYIVTDRSL